MVSASRLRKTSEAAMNARPYADRIFKVHSSVVGRMQEVEGELYSEKQGKTLIVAVAGDKGLCGSFNSNIFKHVEKLLKSQGPENCIVLPIGNRSSGHFTKSGHPLTKGYTGVFRNVTVSLCEEIAKRLVEEYSSDEIGKVVLVFNKFKNVLVQEVTEWQVLPLEKEGGDEAEAGPEHLAEPNLPAILKDLTPRVIMTRVYQALLESAAAEHAARMTAMDAATNNALEMIDQLTLEMNKARQAAITKELIEVVSGAAAL